MLQHTQCQCCSHNPSVTIMQSQCCNHSTVITSLPFWWCCHNSAVTLQAAITAMLLSHNQCHYVVAQNATIPAILLQCCKAHNPTHTIMPMGKPSSKSITTTGHHKMLSQFAVTSPRLMHETVGHFNARFSHDWLPNFFGANPAMTQLCIQNGAPLATVSYKE